MDFATARARLIDKLALEIRDRRVLDAMSRVPRHLFVPPECIEEAYEDRPLPIGLDQTISQPYIVALMTEALELGGSENVLEIGTGSGYQAAILAELCRRVVTVERLPTLAKKAGIILDRLGYANIERHIAGNSLGWEGSAPYQAIMVTAGAPSVPDILVTQLTPGGRLVIPVGSRYAQELQRVVRYEGGNRVENLGGCRFVSLIGKEGWPE